MRSRWILDGVLLKRRGGIKGGEEEKEKRKVNSRNKRKERHILSKTVEE